MKRPTGVFVFIAAGVGLGLFQLKYQVMNLEQDHRRIRKTIRDTDEAIHVLRAEWAHLNDPKRLQGLCERYLAVSPIRGSQLVSWQRVTEDRPGGTAEYDRGAMDQLVADLVSDAKLVALDE
ncbi:MAG: hypothetical protein K0R76_1447 [Alphaproteobacteria bacterium]|jgi:hypothetical protein|nr:hypothetical protein [Alphaproteobacteria bacterium]MDF3034493.1 hypothetical protein [Alphaproteobacteria bacterium]